MGSTEQDRIGTALGVGTGLFLVSLIGMTLEAPTPAPSRRTAHPEEVTISLVGNPEAILAEATTTEYVSCMLENVDHVTRCRATVPDRVHLVTIIVKPEEAYICPRSSPLVWIAQTPRLATFLRIETRGPWSSCVYGVSSPETESEADP